MAAMLRIPPRVHPRACGGNSQTSAHLVHTRGPSPRVRGKPGQLHQRRRDRRSIPARAGETPPPRAIAAFAEVHPRACGGKPPRRVGIEVKYGSIPARAGETTREPYALAHFEVHPRACGGNIYWNRISHTPSGPSPRVRGKPALPPGDQSGLGSIPARAGETAIKNLTGLKLAVHPRACGGNTIRGAGARTHAGPSPRVRGKLRREWRREPLRGSIPARAGETGRRCARAAGSEVHPRACGGNSKQKAKLGLRPERQRSRSLLTR